jgi:hypothetical protein
MNPPPRPHREAVVHYGTPDFEIVQPGDYVRCAVSDRSIPLERLTYWSVELQEAYATAEFMTKRWVETHEAVR